jgi:hypothetical protein
MNARGLIDTARALVAGDKGLLAILPRVLSLTFPASPCRWKYP